MLASEAFFFRFSFDRKNYVSADHILAFGEMCDRWIIQSFQFLHKMCV